MSTGVFLLLLRLAILGETATADVARLDDVLAALA